MGLIEDINFEKNYIIYISIFCLFIFACYQYYQILTRYAENMADVTSTIDTDPIRNLSNLCKSITEKDTLTIPGTLLVDTVNIGSGANLWSISTDTNKNLIFKNGPKDDVAAAKIVYSPTSNI